MPDTPEPQPPLVHVDGAPIGAAWAGLSRRSVLLGGLVGAASLGLGANLLTSTPAFANGPTSAAGVIAEARSWLGMTLGQIRPNTTGSWAGYPDADWCAWFASWCMRGLGLGYQTLVSGLAGAVGTVVSSPAPGDLIVWPGSHVGIVTTVSGSSVTLIDGNGASTGGQTITTRVVAERGKWGSPTYYRPNYSGTGDDMPQTQFPNNSTAISVQALGTWAQQSWQPVPYSGSAYNIAELLGGCSLFQVNVTAYLTGLTAEKQLYMRLATETKTTPSVWSGRAATTVEGAPNTEGRVYANFSTLVPVTQASQRLALQVMSTHPGVTINYWAADISAW